MRKLYILLLSFMVTSVALAQSEKTHHPIQDLLPINGDTLIAAKWYGGLVITYNASKTWQVLPPSMLLKTMTVDNKGVLWGIDSWLGIHERDYSRLYKSADNGKTWKKTTFDTQKFFPLEIVSKPNTPLRVITTDKKEYILTGKNPSMNWKYVSTNLEWEGEIREGEFKILKKGKDGVLLKLKSNWDTIYTFKKLYAFDLHVKQDTIFVVGGIAGNANAYFAYLTKNNQLKEFTIEGMQAYGIREDKKRRIWIFSTEGIYLLDNDNLDKRY